MFTFVLTGQNELKHLQTLHLSGNVLAFVSTAVDGADASSLIISIDTVHKPGSTTEQKEDETGISTPLLSYKFHEGQLAEGGPTFSSAEDEVDISAAAHLGNLLYNLENLRKREGDGGDE